VSKVIREASGNIKQTTKKRIGGLDLIQDSTDNHKNIPNTIILNGYPCCSEHGAMTKVSKSGMWRCLTCHVGFDETRAYLKDSKEGFIK
jgi:5-keto 4-deoxyuronate isomerase